MHMDVRGPASALKRGSYKRAPAREPQQRHISINLREDAMKIATLLKSSTALSMVALLALSACGGGGGDALTTTGGGAAAAPVDGDGMMPGTAMATA